MKKTVKCLTGLLLAIVMNVTYIFADLVIEPEQQEVSQNLVPMIFLAIILACVAIAIIYKIRRKKNNNY